MTSALFTRYRAKKPAKHRTVSSIIDYTPLSNNRDLEKRFDSGTKDPVLYAYPPSEYKAAPDGTKVHPSKRNTTGYALLRSTVSNRVYLVSNDFVFKGVLFAQMGPKPPRPSRYLIPRARPRAPACTCAC